MKEHPIIFSAPMIRALLARRKTQTRRIINPQPKMEEEADHGDYVLLGAPPALMQLRDDGAGLDLYEVRSPFGQLGDTLWVRETWQYGPDVTPGMMIAGEMSQRHIIYAATVPDGQHPPKWRSPIHMPRWASRITLEFVRERFERVQDISEADAIAEGAERNVIDGHEADWEPDWGYRTRCLHYPNGCECDPHPTARDWYADVWDSIHGPGSWNSNPVVRVGEFKRKDGAA